MDLAVSSSIHLPSQTFDWFKEPELISFAHLLGGAGAVLVASGSSGFFWGRLIFSQTKTWFCAHLNHTLETGKSISMLKTHSLRCLYNI